MPRPRHRRVLAHNRRLPAAVRGRQSCRHEPRASLALWQVQDQVPHQLHALPDLCAQNANRFRAGESGSRACAGIGVHGAGQVVGQMVGGVVGRGPLLMWRLCMLCAPYNCAGLGGREPGVSAQAETQQKGDDRLHRGDVPDGAGAAVGASAAQQPHLHATFRNRDDGICGCRGVRNP